jgi:hypothetical protein
LPGKCQWIDLVFVFKLAVEIGKVVEPAFKADFRDTFCILLQQFGSMVQSDFIYKTDK